MNESLNNLATIRQYLLGKISDETMLESIEELLFSDDDFCTKTEIVEDELINDYVFGKLNAEEKLSFAQTLENNSDRRGKVKVTQLLKEKVATENVKEKSSLFDSIRNFFRQPIYAGAFALLLIAILIGVIFLLRPGQSDELAQLEKIYEKERPVESRISDFDYAPLIVTRGSESQTDEEKRRLRLLETKFLEAVESNPTGTNHHALGVFYLTQNKFSESIKELETAVKLDEKNPNFRNDLGSAYFELGKFSKEKQFENFSKANEEFAKALELNPSFLEALFNRALALQELNAWNQAKEAWNSYLQKDSTSKWADEARKKLEKIAQMQSSFKTKEQVLEDFLTAYRKGDEEFAWKINCQTKEMISGVWLPDQLSRRYLEARKNKDEITAKESIEALTYIGNLEKERNADFFVRDLAKYYANTDSGQIDDLLKAKDLLDIARVMIIQRKYNDVTESLKHIFNIFQQNGNQLENLVVKYEIAFNKRDMVQLNLSLIDFNKLFEVAKRQNYQFLLARILSAKSEIKFKMNEISESVKLMKISLEISRKTNDILLIQKNSANLISVYQLLGELDTAHNYTAAFGLNDNDYYESKLQKLRNLWYLSILYRDLNQHFNSVEFAEEALFLAKEEKSPTLIFDSTLDLAISYLSIGKTENALNLAKENLELAGKFEESEARESAFRDSKLQMAHIFRLNRDYLSAVNYYDDVIKILEKQPDYQVESFLAHKGRLVCFYKLNKFKEFEIEIKQVSNLFEKNRNQILDEESRNAFFDREQSFANIATEFYLNQNNPAKAFEYSENSKARSLLDLLENKGYYDEKGRQIVFKKSAQSLSINQIQSKLSPNLQLIQYAVLDEKIAIWVITNTRFEVVILPVKLDLIEQKVKDYLNLLKIKSPLTEQVSQEIFEILLKPIAVKLDKSKQLFIVPDGILYHLPFASLKSREFGKFLIEDFTLIYSPSASTLVIMSEKSKTKSTAENLLIVGNPDFSLENNPKLNDLKSAENEANEIANLYQNPHKLVKNEATKHNVLKNISQANVFHFAGHYVVNPKSSLNSKLLLTQPVNSIEAFDGELRMAEILQIKNQNLKLAVLSACETGIERYYKGEGAIGMARTFLAIGTPIVVASQWKVESDSTSELMKAFHRNRKEKGLITSEALRQAQLEMLANKEFSEPYYWAAFSAVGGNVNF